MSNWLSGWKYRKKITIQGSSGAGTNYQVLLKIGEDSGATGANFHLNGLSDNFPSGHQSGDLRITSSDGSTLLDLWVEKVVIIGSGSKKTAYVWVEVAEDLGTNKDIYVYFGGGASAPNVSNGDNTFLFFDDFDGTSINTNKWTDNTNRTSLSNSIMTLYGGTGNSFLQQNSSNYAYFSSPKAIVSRIYLDGGWWAGFGMYSVNRGNNAVQFYQDANVPRIGVQINGSWTNYTSDWLRASFYRHEIIWKSSETRFYQETASGNTEVANSPISLSPSAYLGATFFVGVNTPFYIASDWIFIRNYTSPEPTFLSEGPLEFLGSRRRLLLSS
jgi:hypothetical protein